jgi:hypothetical protein
MSLKQSQYEIRLNPKPTPKGKRDKTKVEHKKGGNLRRQSNMASLGDKVNMRVNIFDMSQNAT